MEATKQKLNYRSYGRDSGREDERIFPTSNEDDTGKITVLTKIKVSLMAKVLPVKKNKNAATIANGTQGHFTGSKSDFKRAALQLY